MNMRSIKFQVCVALIMGSAGLTACSKSGSTTAAATTASKKETSTNALAALFASSLENDQGMPQASAEALSNKAAANTLNASSAKKYSNRTSPGQRTAAKLGKLGTLNHRFAASEAEAAESIGDDSGLESIASVFAFEVLNAMDDPEVVAVEEFSAEEKLKVAKAVCDAVAADLGANSSDFTDQTVKAELLADVFGAVVEGLAQADLQPDELQSAIGDVMGTYVEALADSGMEGTEVAEYMDDMFEVVAVGLQEGEYEGTDYLDFVSEMMESSIAALGEAGFEAEEMQACVDGLIAGAIGTADDFGFADSGSEFQSFTGFLMVEVQSGIEDGGITEINFEDVRGDMYDAIVEVSDDIGIDSSYLPTETEFENTDVDAMASIDWSTMVSGDELAAPEVDDETGEVSDTQESAES